MLLPALACPAACRYCFGPHHGPTMPLETFDAALDWLVETIPPEQTLDLTFHGGEPLAAGLPWYQYTLPRLRDRFGRRLNLYLQSNLWLLDDDLCALFHEYGLALGTSLDGPPALNDAQRGPGYFERTMHGVDLARRYGLPVGAICTLTSLSAPHLPEILDFFIHSGLSVNVHGAIGGANGNGNHALSLSPEAHAATLAALLDLYLERTDQLQITTFDAMAQGLASGQGRLCTFTDCLGHYLAVAPDGGIYPCNRFVGHAEWQLGQVQDMPDAHALAGSSPWQMLRERQIRADQACADCPHAGYCRGGCAYTALFDGSPDGRDPHCPAYRRVFERMAHRALDEVFSPANLERVVERGPDAYGLLQQGRLVQLMRGGPHPSQVMSQARRAVAAVALACTASLDDAVQRLDGAGLVSEPSIARRSLTGLRRQLDAQPQQRGNAYLHVTYACNLACDHCYAAAGPAPDAPSMPIAPIAAALDAIAHAGFTKAIITGGEPLVHPQRDSLLDVLAARRGAVKPTRLVLRTNLTVDLTPALIRRLLSSADQIVVSLDGDQASHDARRGAGAWMCTINNLRTLMPAAQGNGTAASLVLSAVLAPDQIIGREGDAVRALARELGLGVRFKIELPLGRARARELPLAFPTCLDDPASDIVAGYVHPQSTCGLGVNLFIGPRGEAFPCYALTTPRHALGNVLSDGWPAVLARNAAYRQITVDNTASCSTCALRYLCGGFCRAWSRSDDPQSPPTDCTLLRRRAQTLLESALEVLSVDRARWLEAGLPLAAN